jgi:acyl-CoA thioesterase-1
MNWLIYTFGSGAAFFLGVGCVFVSSIAFSIGERFCLKVLANLAAIVGLVLVAFSATPLSYWLYALATAVTIPWLVAERSRKSWFIVRRQRLRWAAAAVWLVAAAVEAPYHVAPNLAQIGHPTVYIIGDSISAGLNEHETTWPQFLARKRSIEVTDFSRIGADVNSALRQADRLSTDGGLVLLEIGGNDLLGSTSAADYERGLDRLLDRVCVPGRTVLMFELPSLPFCNEFGRIQRRLAARYGVPLIPKRILISVLSGDTATLDSIHLTPAGHEKMADVVWAVIRPAFSE